MFKIHSTIVTCLNVRLELSVGDGQTDPELNVNNITIIITFLYLSTNFVYQNTSTYFFLCMIESSANIDAKINTNHTSLHIYIHSIKVIYEYYSIILIIIHYKYY